MIYDYNGHQSLVLLFKRKNSAPERQNSIFEFCCHRAEKNEPEAL